MGPQTPRYGDYLSVRPNPPIGGLEEAGKRLRIVTTGVQGGRTSMLQWNPKLVALVAVLALIAVFAAFGVISLDSFDTSGWNW